MTGTMFCSKKQNLQSLSFVEENILTVAEFEFLP